MNVAWGALAAGVVGAIVAALIAPSMIRKVPAHLVRTNVSGRPVPAVLGWALCAGGIAGLAVAWLIDRSLDSGGFQAGVAAATGLLVVGMGAAGYVDDRRGDEESRGFGGHLRAAFSGRITGGGIKVVVGGLVSLGAGALVWGFDDPADLLTTALAVALTANLLNLLDRGPGRAAKVGLLLLLPGLALAKFGWPLAGAGVTGALVACLPADLRERAMLGDAGANPLGAVAGLGLCLATSLGVRIVLVLLLLGLNLASERVSFSSVIERTTWLAAVDRWGRA